MPREQGREVVTEPAPPHPDAEIVERMELDLPAESEGELETRAIYLRLISRIRDLELDEPDPGWEDRAVERWRREAGARAPGRR